MFPRTKRVIFSEVKENKDLRGGVLLYAAQARPQFDAEIGKKGRFGTGTGYSNALSTPTKVSTDASDTALYKDARSPPTLR